MFHVLFSNTIFCYSSFLYQTVGGFKEKNDLLFFIPKLKTVAAVTRFNNNHNSQDLSMRRSVHTFYKLFYRYLFSISINLVIGHNYHYYIHFSSTLKYLENIFIIYEKTNIFPLIQGISDEKVAMNLEKFIS